MTMHRCCSMLLTCVGPRYLMARASSETPAQRLLLLSILHYPNTGSRSGCCTGSARQYARTSFSPCAASADVHDVRGSASKSGAEHSVGPLAYVDHPACLSPRPSLNLDAVSAFRLFHPPSTEISNFNRLFMDSTLRKRRRKMSKHKRKKLRKLWRRRKRQVFT